MMQPAPGMQYVKKAIDILEGVQLGLSDMTDNEWLAYVHPFLLPLDHFKARFASIRLDV